MNSTTATVQSHSTTATVQSSLSYVAAIVAPIVIILLLLPAIAIVTVTILILFRNKKLLQEKYDTIQLDTTGSSSTSATNTSAMDSGGGNHEYAEIDIKQPPLNATAGITTNGTAGVDSEDTKRTEVLENKCVVYGEYEAIDHPAKKIVSDNTSIIGNENQVKVESKNNKMRSSEYEDVDTRAQKLASDKMPKSVSGLQYEDMDNYIPPPNGSVSAKPPEKQLASENIPKSVSGPHYENMDSFLPPNGSDSAKPLPDNNAYNRWSFDFGQSGRRNTHDPSDSNYSHLEPIPAYEEMRPRIDTDPHVYTELQKTQKKSEHSKAIDAIMEESVPPVQAS